MAIGSSFDALQAAHDRRLDLATNTYLTGLRLQLAQDEEARRNALASAQLPLYFQDRALAAEQMRQQAGERAYQRGLQDRYFGLEQKKLLQSGMRDRAILAKETERETKTDEANSLRDFDRLGSLIDAGRITSLADLKARGADEQPEDRFSQLREQLGSRQVKLRQDYFDTAQSQADELNAEFEASVEGKDLNPAARRTAFNYFVAKKKPAQLKYSAADHTTQTFFPRKDIADLPADAIPYVERPKAVAPVSATESPAVATTAYGAPIGPEPAPAARSYFANAYGGAAMPRLSFSFGPFGNPQPNLRFPTATPGAAPVPAAGPVAPPRSILPTPAQFDSEAQARAAGYRSGDVVTVFDQVTGRYRRARLD